MITTGVLSKMSVRIFLIVFLIQHQTMAFNIFSFRKSSLSRTHQNITRTAILETTVEVCKIQALHKGKEFMLPHPLTEESLASACSSPDSAKGFKRSVEKIKSSNAWTDFYYVFHPEYHFDNEKFLAAWELITKGVSIVKASVKKQSYEVARGKLGEVLHTLQDFYSHSNWIELGKEAPYSNLIKPWSQIDHASALPTCRSCKGNDCKGNILEGIITQQQLTSGYFDMFNFFKPKGKCSHGGFTDRTSRGEPKGGINKDDIDSSHGYLHLKAAEVATAATRELLEDIRAVTGDAEFLRLMGFTQSSVLCFVIDTTDSMSGEIAEVLKVTSVIIDSKMGTATPSEYILVPFNDPVYGPLTRTTDPDLFKRKISALKATGGGDAPEMCLSALQLALTGSPPGTEIFVFTDADAKDKRLKSTVLALIEKTKSVVTFMLTNALGAQRRDNGRINNGLHQTDSRISKQSSQDYRELAEASGGHTIEVTKTTLTPATSIIEDRSSSSLVTLLQAVRNPAKVETFSVFVDSTLKKLTVYITCNSPSYTISSPSGVSQTNAEPSGALGVIQIVGNIHMVHSNISDQAGLWIISIASTEPYTIKVLGQSDVDFLFDFVTLRSYALLKSRPKANYSTHPSYAVLNSRPNANNNITLLVTMVGGNGVTLTEVSLVDASGSDLVNKTLEEVTSGQYLVTFKSVPAEEFVVRVIGEISSSRSSVDRFQRQSPAQLQASNVTITAQDDGTLEPGRSFTLPFTVATSGPGGDFNIRVSNDRGFMTEFPSSLTLLSGGEANGTVTLFVPGTTSSGSDVTVTIEAEAPGGSDSNFAVLRLAVVAPVTDITPPACQIVSINDNCSGNCSLFTWDLSVNITDGNGSGIQSIRVLQGMGTLNTTTALGNGGENVTLAFYTASCCFPMVKLVAVDEVGNVGICLRSVDAVYTTVPSTEVTTIITSNATAIPTSSAGYSFLLPVCFWLNMGAITLYCFF